MSDAKTTTNHETIRKWAEARDGAPATVKGTAPDDEAGLLRIDFGPKEERLEEISWDEFFEKFDENDLVLVYEDDSNFSKLVSRESAESKGH